MISLARKVIVLATTALLLCSCSQAVTSGINDVNQSGIAWADQSLVDIYNTHVPVHDPVETGSRLFQETYKSVLTDSAIPLQSGAKKDFWVASVSEEQTDQVSATLRLVTDHLYLWIQDGISYDQSQLAELSVSFDETIYPRVREVYGSEWSPGIDQDEHINILYAAGLGYGMGGYFSSIDEYSNEVYTGSNMCEIVVVNADEVPLNGTSIDRIISHEFQHMIHWNADVNEDVWLNEGFSEYAVNVAGITDNRLPQLYLQNPDKSLVYWEDSNAGLANAPLYGQVYLFTSYFAERYGMDRLKGVVADPSNGIVSYDKALRGSSLVDYGVAMTSFYKDWVAANVIQANKPDDLWYGYSAVKGLHVAPLKDFTDCVGQDISDSVNQFGVDYYKFSCPGDWTVSFVGSDSARLVSTSAHSGSYVFWSNRADKSDTKLTKSFDLSGSGLNPYLSFYSWYQIEQGRDYLYIQISEDGGNTWKIVSRPQQFASQEQNIPTWGLTGKSRGWEETVLDLSEYAGKSIIVRFEYITDTSLLEDGFLVDDISVPDIGYFCDFEEDPCGWETEGFVRINPSVDQYYGVQLISRSFKDQMIDLPLLSNESTFDFRVKSSDRPVYVAVSALSPFVIEPAGYSLKIDYRRK